MADHCDAAAWFDEQISMEPSLIKYQNVLSQTWNTKSDRSSHYATLLLAHVCRLSQLAIGSLDVNDVLHRLEPGRAGLYRIIIENLNSIDLQNGENVLVETRARILSSLAWGQTPLTAEAIGWFCSLKDEELRGEVIFKPSDNRKIATEAELVKICGGLVEATSGDLDDSEAGSSVRQS